MSPAGCRYVSDGNNKQQYCYAYGHFQSRHIVPLLTLLKPCRFLMLLEQMMSTYDSSVMTNFTKSCGHGTGTYCFRLIAMH